MKTVLVTGASGFLGHHLVQELLKEGSTEVIAILGRPEDKVNMLPQSERVRVYPCSDIFTKEFGHIDTLIHTAFSRGEDLSGLSSSIEFTRKIIAMVNERDIDSIINISSQGVYKGQQPGQKATEDSVIEPNTAYGLAKWCVENMIEIGCRKPFTSIRMASLSANARFLMFFANSIKEGKDIIVTSPNQYASIMDVSDAVSGIKSAMNIPISKRQTVYNLGPGVQYSILEYAQIINSIGQELKFTPANIYVDDKGSKYAICMDCQRLITDAGWTPKVTKEKIIKNLF